MTSRNVKNHWKSFCLCFYFDNAMILRCIAQLLHYFARHFPLYFSLFSLYIMFHYIIWYASLYYTTFFTILQSVLHWHIIADNVFFYILIILGNSVLVKVYALNIKWLITYSLNLRIRFSSVLLKLVYYRRPICLKLANLSWS